MLEIRRLQEVDAIAAHKIQCSVYPAAVCDTVEIYLAGIYSYPEGHIGAFYDGVLAGYFIFKPWKGEYGIENNPHFIPEEDADHIFLMDMAVLPEYRGRGLPKKFLEFAYTTGDKLGLRLYRGIAVQGAEKIWEHYGYRITGQKQYGPMVGHLVEKVDHAHRTDRGVPQGTTT